MKIVLDKGAFEPKKAHEEDAGYDLRSPKTVMLKAHGCICIDTGVHMAIPAGFYGKLESKSGLNVKRGIVSLGGVIDSGYTGSIVTKLYNLSGREYMFRRGDKVVQIIIQPCAGPLMEIVESLDDTERGGGGFGSSGR